MKQVIVLKGLPARGKSTWAKQQLAKHPGQLKRVSKDDLRAMLDDGKWSKGNEKKSRAVIHKLCCYLSCYIVGILATNVSDALDLSSALGSPLPAALRRAAKTAG